MDIVTTSNPIACRLNIHIQRPPLMLDSKFINKYSNTARTPDANALNPGDSIGKMASIGNGSTEEWKWHVKEWNNKKATWCENRFTKASSAEFGGVRACVSARTMVSNTRNWVNRRWPGICIWMKSDQNCNPRTSEQPKRLCNIVQVIYFLFPFIWVLNVHMCQAVMSV